MPSLEIASFTSTSALIASRSGAHRIELCTSQADGGLTPLVSDFVSLKAAVKIPIYIMIRPHAHSFTYSSDELSEMEKDIEAFREKGADGLVFGVLDEEGRVDEVVNRRLVEKAGGKACTFHRAFDSIPIDLMEEQLEIIISCGFTSLLTSGGARSAVEGKEVLKRLVERAGDRIDVIVGGGVRSVNLGELRRVTGARWFHSSAVVDGGEEASEGEVRGLREEVDR